MPPPCSTVLGSISMISAPTVDAVAWTADPSWLRAPGSGVTMNRQNVKVKLGCRQIF